MFLENGGAKWYVLIIVLVIIIFIFAMITIFRRVIKKHKFNKLVRDIENKYEYVHALLIGQDSSYLKRIYAISSCNLLYAEVYNNFLKQYEELLQTQDEQAQTALKMLKDSLDKTKGKSKKENIKRNKEILEEYVKQVENFSNELKSTLQKEEDAQVKSLQQKETLRNLKNSYFENRQALRLVENSFDILFQNIDEAFKRYDEAIDCANYDEVDKILLRIGSALQELEPVLEKLPLLCAKVENVVPSKIANLQAKYDEMISQQFPLNHLHVSATISEFDGIIENITLRLRAFDLTNCNEELDNIILNVDNVLALFDKEVEAKNEYENDVDDIYHEVKNLENKFIKICNIIPEVKKDYILQDKYINDIDVIKFNISRLGVIKRTLDNYIHSNIKQPYTLLNSKCNELKEESRIVGIKLNDFSAYLLSLESDYNASGDIIYQSYFELKESKKVVHETYVEKFKEQINPKLDKAFAMLDEIDNNLKKHPIDMQLINDLVLKFVKYKEELTKEIEENSNFALITENLVVYANKDRHHLSDMRVLLTQIEESFFEGEFERSYLDAGNTTKKLKSAIETENK